MSYCKTIKTIQPEDRQALHRKYHDHLYGFPLHDDNEIFGRLILEINQAGLSWETILKKEEAFRQAFHQFDIQTIAQYTEQDFDRLMQNESIIRNKLKIQAVIENAKTVIQLQKQHGSFEGWLIANHPKSKDEWVKLFKKTFRFTGGEIVNEFLMSIGFLPGAHDEDCPIYHTILNQNPMWTVKKCYC